MLSRLFPILTRKIHGHHLVYLDNAATTQKPQAVINAISDFYKQHNANIHRGIHTLSVEATNLYESSRDKIQKFLDAHEREEIIFTTGATEGINLVAWTWGQENIKRGDEILLTEMEHHSNLVPWQVLAKKKGAKLRFIPLTAEGRLDLRNLERLITRRTKIVSIAHISNVLGVVNPVKRIVRAAHAKGAVVLVDGAQAGGHLKINVQKLGCDFFVLSGHKMYGPTGVGILYGRRGLLEKMPPYKTGGHMIKKVGLTSHIWNDLPWKFEAGTANIAEVIGFGAAIDFLSKVGFQTISNHESRITNYALKKLQKIPGLTIYGPKDNKNRIGVISFNLKGIPAHDLASILDEKGIAIRTGHHCAMPLHEKLGIPSSARASFAIYNTKKDVDKLIAGLKYAKNLLK
jgi:cysteine desulfurase/selenocysteine lyase